MPRFYCDYCDAYLTHDSPYGRMQHNRGWKHRESFKAYYQKLYPEWLAESQQKHLEMMQNIQMGNGKDITYYYIQFLLLRHINSYRFYEHDERWSSTTTRFFPSARHAYDASSSKWFTGDVTSISTRNDASASTR